MKTLRADFPIFNNPIKGKRLAYLDNAATTQKPNCLIDAYKNYYTNLNSNVHRGVHYLSEESTLKYEATREKIRNYINAKHCEECIFVRGATEGINLVAHSFGNTFVKPNDEILITALEHHANIVPWQQLCERNKATLKVLPITVNGEMQIDKLPQLLNSKTKLFAFTHTANSIGTTVPVKLLIKEAHKAGVPVLIDGAQALPHGPVDVQDLDCDFFVGSAHKMYGPTGIGLLYGKKSWLEKMPPFQSGGNMIKYVTFCKTEYNDLPYKFEAGTPAIAETIAWGSCLDYLQELDWLNINKYQQYLTDMTIAKLEELPGIKIFGNTASKSSIISFQLDNIHAHDMATILDKEGVAVRGGHHCSMPLLKFLQVPATTRISFGLYNNEEDVQQVVAAIKYAQQLFNKVK